MDKKNNKHYFDLSESLRPDLQDNSNKKVYGKFKDELNSLSMSEVIALNPKIYSYNYQKLKDDDTIESTNKKVLKGNYIYQKLSDDKTIELENKKVLKGVSKVVVKKEITHENYIDVLTTNIPLIKNITSIRSHNQQLYTTAQNKVALTSYYDKMKMLNSIDCVPFGYNPK